MKCSVSWLLKGVKLLRKEFEDFKKQLNNK